jgi:two-component system, cell cycle sensor histidine kinase and response regulator CckA
MKDSHLSKLHFPFFPREDGIPASIGWVRKSTGLAACGYIVLSLYGFSYERGFTGMSIQEAAASLLLAFAFFYARSKPVAAAVLALSAALWETLLSFFLSGTLILSSLGSFPVLVIASGMLFGTLGAVGMALLCGLGIPLTMYLSGAWSHDLSQLDMALQGNALIVTEMIIIITAALTSGALQSNYRSHSTSERLRRRYMDLFQNAPDGLVALDGELRIVEINPTAMQIFGTNSANLLGAVFPQVMRRAGAQGPLDIHMSKLGAPLSVKLLNDEGKERTLEITSRTELSPEAPTLLIIRDVTLRRALEERLGHAQRLESVGRLAGGVAHDFNNLLTVVSGNASILETHPDPEVIAQARDILEAGERGAKLTRQLLAFARRDQHQPVVLDLSLALSGMTRLLERLLGEQHHLEIRFDASVMALADLTQLEQVVLNLVSNARDAMPSGGTVSIDLRALDLPQAAELGSTLDVPRQAMLAVADMGTGMTPDTKARLFEPFFTTKPRGRGTGLGLASVHGIVAQNNGTISVDTEEGKGTRFRIFFPLAQDSGLGSLQPADTAQAFAGGSEHILLVEDEAHVRALGARILTRAGYTVSEAANADEALLLSSSNTDITLLVSDIVMPGMSGPQLAARIRDRLPKMKVLFMSGHSEVDIDNSVELDDRRNLLTKPFNSDDLLRRVRKELDREW